MYNNFKNKIEAMLKSGAGSQDFIDEGFYVFNSTLGAMPVLSPCDVCVILRSGEVLIEEAADINWSAEGLPTWQFPQPNSLVGNGWRSVILYIILNDDMKDDEEQVVEEKIPNLHRPRLDKIDFGQTTPKENEQKKLLTAADVLGEMSNTFRERNKVYGDNFKMVAKLVKVLFPNGVPPDLVVDDNWHLFELKLVKLSRFAISNLTHIDSIHDDSVYGAMIEANLINREIEGKE